MPEPIKDIDRPLGQALRKERKPGSLRLTPGSVVSLVAVLAIVGVSAAIALRGKPYRAPIAVAEAPKTEMAAKPVETPAAPAPPPAASAPTGKDPSSTGGPRIIHVQPVETGGPAQLVIHDPSSLSQNLAVAHLPDMSLIEHSDAGLLPVRSPDGRRAFDVYARPWSGTRGARIAIVIGGLAISQTSTQAAIAKLPPEVTLAFAPQGNSIGRWMQAARQSGHEIAMQVPLEPYDYPNVNPGRNTLTVAASPQDNLKNLRWALARTTNYTAVMNYMGARFTSDAAAMTPFMEELGKRGLGYVDDGSSARSVAADLAPKDDVPLAVADTTIDSVQDRGAILKKLDELEATARAKGFAIGTGTAFDVTVDTVASWVNQAKARGIEIVPISAVANDPERKG